MTHKLLDVYDSDTTYALYRDNLRRRLRETVSEILGYANFRRLQKNYGIRRQLAIISRGSRCAPFFLEGEKARAHKEIYFIIKYFEQIRPRLVARLSLPLPIHPLTSFLRIVLPNFIDPLSRFKTFRL